MSKNQQELVDAETVRRALGNKTHRQFDSWLSHNKIKLRSGKIRLSDLSQGLVRTIKKLTRREKAASS
jgi:hypothetical protein